MGDVPEAENTEHSMIELITGIGKLVYKLNESLDSIDKRVEKFESGISSLLEEKFDSLRSELVKSNELLAGFGNSVPAGGTEKDEIEKPVPGESSDVTVNNGLIEKLDELKAEITGIREDLTGAEKKFLKTLTEGPENSVKKKLLTEELTKVTVLISESASTMQKTVTDAIGQSDENRKLLFSEGISPLSDELIKISSKLDKASESVEKKLDKIQSSTVSEVGTISASVKENSEAQKEQLQQMKELLTLHSVEVQDNRVRSLNRSAIVHFNNAEYDQSLSVLREALELSPESSELLANMAHIEASMGQLEKAEEHFKQALKINPDLDPAISGLGTVMLISGRAGDTIDFLQKYLKEGSDTSTGVMIALSRAYAAQDNHAKALELLEKAEKIAPGHPELEQELAKYRV